MDQYSVSHFQIVIFEGDYQQPEVIELCERILLSRRSARLLVTSLRDCTIVRFARNQHCYARTSVQACSILWPRVTVPE